MKITDKVVEHLNFQLDDLNIDGTKRFVVEEFISSSNSMDEDLEQSSISNFTMTIKYLLQELNSFDDNIPIISDNASLAEIFAALGKYTPHFGMDAAYVYYRLLHHLVSRIQTERLHKYHVWKTLEKMKSEERGRILFQLEKLCQIFSLPMDDSFDCNDEVDVILRLSTHVEDTMKSLNISNLFENQKPILPLGLKLNSQQQIIFDTLQEAIYQDFLIRRKMLLKRMDVTIQSFLWSELAQGREDEILSTIQAQRESIMEEPTRYKLEDILQAPEQLIYESSKKITEQRGGKKSLVKTVIIGAVPDRGGRTDDVRKSAGGSSTSSSSYRGRGGGSGGGGKPLGGKGGDRHSNKRGRY